MYYFFGVTSAGAYTVTEIDLAGYVSTTPNEVAVMVEDADVTVDFGDRLIAEVPVDVKPGSDINPLNLRSQGVLPAAILGSEDFDVTLIDPDSLLLDGVAPIRMMHAKRRDIVSRLSTCRSIRPRLRLWCDKPGCRGGIEAPGTGKRRSGEKPVLLP